MRRVVGGALRVLRAGWLAIGIGLALLVAAEGAYRLQGAVRAEIRAVRAPKSIPNPAADLLADSYASTDHELWHPYIYLRRMPYKGRYATVDSMGLRRTVQATDPRDAAQQVFMFGASPLWGTGVRDSMTIPSRLAAHLESRGINGVAITNFGEGGEVLTQELIDLMLQLRAGARPSVVAFYDGYNDIASAMESGKTGLTKAEASRARDFATGQDLYPWRYDFGTNTKVFAHLAGISATRFLIFNRLGGSALSGERAAPVPDDSLVNDVVHTYMRTVDLIETLGRSYGFTPFYFWMPMLDPTQKRMSPFERQMNDSLAADAWTVRFLRLHRRAVQTVTPLMNEVAPGRFSELSGLFANDSATVYVEQGHTTESANTVIASHLANFVVPALESAKRHPPVATRAPRGR